MGGKFDEFMQKAETEGWIDKGISTEVKDEFFRVPHRKYFVGRHQHGGTWHDHSSMDGLGLHEHNRTKSPKSHYMSGGFRFGFSPDGTHRHLAHEYS